jgi:HME family heavy-metal exporter
MLDSIIRYALRFRFVTLLASVIALVGGSYLATTMSIDVLPDLDRPRVVILTECPGLATEEVEALVSNPIEISLLAAAGVEDVRSQTTSGLNVVFVEFNWKTDAQSARQAVQERLRTVEAKLPAGIVPQMTPQSSIMGQIMTAGMFRRAGPNGGRLIVVERSDFVVEMMDADGFERAIVWRATTREFSEWKKVETEISPIVKSEPISWRTPFVFEVDGVMYSRGYQDAIDQSMELRTIADWVIRPRLLQVPGTAEVFVQGGDRKQYQVLIDPTALLEYDVSLPDVHRALSESNLNTSGGYAVTGESERPIRILGRVGPGRKQVIADLEKVPIKRAQKRTILLGNVAKVTVGPEFKRGDGAVNGQPGVVFTIAKQPHFDTRRLTDELVRAMEEIEASLPADIQIDTELFRLRDFIDRGVFNVAEALVVGALLVIVVLFLFLMNFRTTLITLTAIPLSVVVTTLVFRGISYFTGTELTINVMTLGGLAVAMGELVDDAIVDVENIFRRLKENNAAENPRPAIRVVYEASLEVRNAIVFGTVVVILVFLPLLGIGGIVGRLFTPLAVAYIVSILSSLLVSLTVTPVLSFYLLPKSKSAYREVDGFLLRWLKRLAAGLIRISMAIPGPLMLLTWIGVVFSAVIFASLGGSLLPDFDEGSIQVNTMLPTGSSLEASNRVSAQIDQTLNRLRKSEQNPGGEVLGFVRRTGRAELDEHALPVNSSEYIISMNPESGLDREEAKKKIRDQIESDVPGVSIEVEQPLAHMINHMVSGVYAQIAVKIFGDDIDELERLAKRTKVLLGDVDGITTPIVEPIRRTEELHIRLRTEDLAYYGLTRKYVGSMLQTALQGEVVSQVIQGQRRFDLLIRLEEQYRTDYTNLERLRIDLPDDRGQVELAQLADVNRREGPNSVFRENAQRRIVIRCNTEGRDLTSAVAEIRTKLSSELILPKGYALDYSGQFVTKREADRRILILSGVAMVGVFAVLMILLPSVRIVLQILNALPTAFIGGVIALVLTGQDLSVASLVGFISLGGIAVRNGILLVTHYVHLMQHEGETFSQDMILRGSLERLAPVLMTSLTAGIALLPLVIGGNEPGREILYPVATVIVGGLVTSTFCEFLIHPGLFWKFSGRDAQRLANRDEANEI